MRDFLKLENIGENNISINNDLIKIEFLQKESYVNVAISIKKKNKWIPIGSNFIKEHKKKGKIGLLEISHGIASNDLNLTLYNVKQDKNKIVVILKGINEFYQVIIKFILKENAKFIHVENILTVFRNVSLEYFMNSYQFTPKGNNSENNPDFVWIPNLKPFKDGVIGDHVFRSPAIILYQDGLAMSLIPDLDVMAENRRMEMCLDYLKPINSDVKPYLSFGFMEYDTKGHVYYKKAGRTKKGFKNTQLIFGYFLYFDEADTLNDVLRNVNSFIWNQNAKKIIDSTVKPQVISLDKYGKYTYDAIFGNFSHTWREFEVESEVCGGYFWQTWSGGKKNPKPKFNKDVIVLEKATKPSLIYRIFQNYLSSSYTFLRIAEIYLRITGGMVAPQYIFNQAWFSNLRSAFGMMYFAKQWNDNVLIEKANKMRNLALLSPEEQGLFYSIIAVYQEKGEQIKKWLPGSVAVLPADHFHLPDNSWTGFWLLKWYETYENDNRMLEKCKRLGDSLIKLQDNDGSIPTWIKIENNEIKINNYLKNSASTAAPMLFLAKLYEISKVKKYLEASKKAAAFIEKQVIPEDKWFDYETFFSCSRKELDMIDEFTSIYPQNNLSVQWAAEAFKHLYILTQDDKYLDLGLHCLEILCLYQQVWDAPYISINTFGGFGVMNTDAEWNDARQAQFALTFMEYYEITGNKEFFERGIAALRAAFAMMLINENKEVAPGNFKQFNEFDIGGSYENYGHSARDRKILGYIQFDWGSASASCSAALALMQYGDIYIDLEHQNVFGINGIMINEINIDDKIIELTLKSEVNLQKKVMLKFRAPKSEKYTLIINKRKLGSKSKKELEKGILLDPKF